MCVPSQNGVDTAHAAGHLEVHVHAVVREHDHHLGALGANLVHHLLQIVVLNAEAPVRHHVARVGDRRVRKGLADDGHGHAVDLADHIGLEHRIAEIGRLDVLRHKVGLRAEVLVDDLLHALHAVGELPVARHHVHAQQLAGIDHVLGLGPQRSGRALPGIAAVQQQRARARGAHALDQRGQMGKPAHLAVAPGRRLEVQIAEGMGRRRAWLDAHGAQQMLAHQMRALVLHRRDTEIDTGFAKVNRVELSMAVRHMQQGHIAERRHLIQGLVGQRLIGVGIALQSHARDTGCRQHLQKFAFGKTHADIRWYLCKQGGKHGHFHPARSEFA